jgi:hypothetical protein
MVLVLQEKPNATQARTDAMIRTISTRNAGGKSVEQGLPLVGILTSSTYTLTEEFTGCSRCP